MSSATSSFSDEYIPDSGIKHDVFLSFRGEDTRTSFTSQPYASLRNAGFTFFKDDHSLQRGDYISTSLLQGIHASGVSVIVFSKNYAGPQWCQVLPPSKIRYNNSLVNIYSACTKVFIFVLRNLTN